MIKKDVFLKGLIMFLFFDFVGFCVWSLSGQFPVDSFYLGVITKNIISSIL